jgi:hypothetical protein
MKFDQEILMRALQFKNMVEGQPSGNTEGMEKLIEEHASKSDEFKTVCAPISVPLFERMGEAMQKLGISKRQFIELAIVEALDRVDTIFTSVDIFENVRTDEDATK